MIQFRPAKDYKPAKVNEAALGDRAFVIESLDSLNASFTSFLHDKDTPSHLNTAEEAYYTILSLLSALVVSSLTAHRTEPAPPIFSTLVSSVKSSLASLRLALFSSPPTALDMGSVFYQVADQHTISSFRDAALAVKQTAAFVLAFNESEMARDRSGKANLHKEVVAEMRAFEALGVKALVEVKGHIKVLNGKLNEPGWLDRAVDWASGSDVDGGGDDEVAKDVFELVDGQPVVEEWAGRLLESWREGIKGWSVVRME